MVHSLRRTNAWRTTAWAGWRTLVGTPKPTTVPSALAVEADRPDTELLARPRLERALGVIYRPETERASHYFRADMRDQFDGIFHFETHAVEPLEKPERWHDPEPPETFPTRI
jgi:erythromycin esterase-like protein